jgi:hypothetical protein
MASTGFAREGNRYVHPRAPLFVEFLPGPLAIGSDNEIRPVRLEGEAATFLALSPTDSCRDRLAAYFYWHDRQSFRTAVEIALRHRLKYRAIREWSLNERHAEEFEEFMSEVRRVRAARRRAASRPKG